MTRHVTDAVRHKIEQFEGLRLRAYLDGGGVPTIGYGHTRGVKLGMVITQEQADEFLKADLAKAESAVERLVKPPLNDNQFGALVSFVFNLGEGAFQKSTLLRKLNAGKYEAVPSELAKYVYDEHKRVPGLVNRRAAEAGLWASGSFVSSNTVDAGPPPPTKALVTPEVIIGGAVPTATAMFGAASNGGPIAWAVAGVIIVCVIAAGFFFCRRMREAAS